MSLSITTTETAETAETAATTSNEVYIFLYYNELPYMKKKIDFRYIIIQ